MLQVREHSKTSAFDLDWEELAAIEPGLVALHDEVRRLKDPGGPCFCVETLWHRRYKARLAWLVGFRTHNDDPRLRTMAAYDVAFEKIYNAMPACRGCACMS